jgi:hypothetical protein
MATTTNYGWTTPDDTALVKDGASAIRTLGSSVDTSVKALNPGTTAGDLDYYTAATTKARIAKGTAGQVFTMNAGATAPEWQTASSGGMTLLSTTTLSGASTTISSINQTYNSLYVLIYGVTNATGNGNLYMRANNSTTNASVIQSWSTSLNMIEGGDLYLTWDAQKPTNSSANNIWVVQIDNYTSTTKYKGLTYRSTYERGGPNQTATGGWGGFGTNSAISSLVFVQSGGNFSAGTVLVYGVK